MLKYISVLWLVFGYTYSASAQMSALDVAGIQAVSTALISENGQFVIYTVNVPADPLKENTPAQNKLYLYDMAGGMSHPLVTQGSVSGVSIRPGHRSVTFLNKRDGDQYTSLYELSLDGGEAQNIFNHTGNISFYQWNFDGTKICFGSSEPEKSSGSLPYHPELYEKNLPNRKAYVADLTSDRPAMECAFKGHLVSLKWSPDGNKLAAFMANSPLIDDFYMTRKLQIVELRQNRVSATIEHEGKKGDFAWSPDSKHIAFIAGADINDPIDGRLFVASATGGQPKNLKPDFEGAFESLLWVDNRTIRYLASEGVWSTIGDMSMNGEIRRSWVAKGEMVIQDMSWAGNEAGAFVVGSPKHPNELYVKKPGSKILRATDLNPWIKERQLAKQEIITYRASDGLDIEGLLIYPLKYEADKTYPVIHYVHGGPESHENNDWKTSYSKPGQVAATNGYAVFYPNYRGSTGRGYDFTMSSQGDPAGKEFDDIVDGVKHLIAIGLSDSTKVGVTGGSYGGYATGWMSTRYSKYFAAGVMFVGISNKVSKWGTTDIPHEEYLVHARKWVWEDYEYFLKRSPVYYADQCKTPLLIMHGAEDPRVHPGQSMELYRHVKVRTDTPVSLVFYPGEGHGNQNSTARLDYHIRSMRWFEKYLMGKDVDVDAPIEVDQKILKP